MFYNNNYYLKISFFEVVARGKCATVMLNPYYIKLYFKGDAIAI